MNKRLLARLAALSASVGVAGQALAAPSEAFTTAVSTVTTDVAAYGAALLGVGAVGVGFMVGLKYLKKIRGAA